MSDFKAKMHQIQFRLGLHPDPAGELTALPRPPAGFKELASEGTEPREWREGRGPLYFLRIYAHAPMLTF